MSSRLEQEAPVAAAANENGNEISSEPQEPEKTWQKSDREFLLVVVTFLATVSFQAGINPPGGVWQDDTDPRYEAGKSIMATKYPSRFVTFIVGVTWSMLISMVQILMLVFELPYKRLSVSRNFLFFGLGSTMSGMISAYWSSIQALTPKSLSPQVTISLVTNVVVTAILLGILLCIQKSRSMCRC